MGIFSNSQTTQYGQIGGQATNDLVGGLNYFDPWGYTRSPGKAGKYYGQDLKDLYSGNVGFDQIKGLKTAFDALDAQNATSGRQVDYQLGSGDAALGNSGLLNAQRGELANQRAQSAAAQKLGAVNDYRQEAARGYQSARNEQDQAGLGAAGLALQGKEGALRGYLDSFKPLKQQNNPSAFSDALNVGSAVFGAG